MEKKLTGLVSVISGLILFFVLPGSSYADLNLELPDLGLPEISEPSASVSGYSPEAKQGIKILRNLRRSGKIIEDPELNLWIRSLGNRLYSRAPQSSTPLYFLIAKDSNINAFATVGGVVVVNAGLILKTDTESELAAVLSHEIAHVTQQHIARMIARSQEDRFAQGAALLAGVVAGTQDSQVGQAIISTTLATSLHNQLSYSRDAESEADSVGLKILARSKYDPRGMPLFLQKLEQLADDRNSDITKYLQSHPLAHSRVLDAQLAANKLANQGIRDTVDYLYLREKLRAINHDSGNPPANAPIGVKNYAQALKLFEKSDFTNGIKILGSNSRIVPEAILKAEMLNKQRKFNQVVDLLSPLLAIYPENEAIMLPLLNAYTGLRRPGMAWNILKKFTPDEQTSLEFFEVRQQIAHQSGHDAEAYRSVAERNMRMGEYKYAAVQLRKAMKMPDANASQILEYQNLLAQVESLKK